MKDFQKRTKPHTRTISCFFLISGVLAIALAGCGAQMQQKQIKHALNLSVDHFVRSIVVKDDAFEDTVTFSTKRGFQEKRGLLGIVWSDEFLRGFIHKKTGHRSYQVYVALKHQSRQWLHPYQANFGKPLIIRKVTKIRSDVDCTGSKYTGCTYFEHVAFELPEAELLRVVENATTVDMRNKVWGFKIKNQAGKDYMSAILLSEIIGLKKAMDSYKPIAMR